MKSIVRKSVSYVVLMSLLLGAGQVAPKAVGADTAVMVHIIQQEGNLNHAEHRTLTVGETRTGWTIELNKDRTVKSAEWSTTDSSIATVTGDKSSASVMAHKEGTSILKLKVVTNKNETVSSECILSVVTKLSADKQAMGYVKNKAAFYRGASTSSTVRNTASSGQSLTVIALCGNFYRVKLPESYDFQDELNQSTTYVLKSQIEIPVTSVNITNAENLKNIKVGENAKLECLTLPEIATSKNILWKSSDTKIVTVNDGGEITAIKSGTADITATDKNSGSYDKVTVTVGDIFLTSLKIVNADTVHYMAAGSTADLQIKSEPSNATKKELTWKSSNPNILTVSNTGKVKAVKPGTVTVTVSDQCSGISDTTAVYITYSLSINKRKRLITQMPKVKLKTATDFRGIYLQWNKIKGAKYYKLYREHWNKKKKRYVKTYKNGKWIKSRNYIDADVEKNKNYKYYVVAYKTKKKALTAGIKKVKKVKIKATAPTLKASSNSMDCVKLNWKAGIAGKTKGIKGYIVTRYKKKNGKADKVWKKSKKTYQMTDKGLSSGTTYYYTVCAYRKWKKKIYKGALSNVASATTISVSKNLSYFAKTENRWQGICRERTKRTQSESTNLMRNYGITVTNDSGNSENVYPFLKFHFAGDTLYIHLYVSYLKHSDKTGSDETVPNTKVIYGDKVEGGSYKEEFINGVTSIYSTSITGNAYDFEKGVRFNTKMVLHEIDQEPYVNGQQFLRVSLGGECPDSHTGNNAWLDNWPHCSGEPDGCPYRTDRMYKRQNNKNDYAFLSYKVLHMPDNNRLIYSDGKLQEPYTLAEYRATCAHELGHILGLADGYVLNDYYNINLERMTYTKETCYKNKNNDWFNIMIYQCDYPCVRTNDMEMILTAYSKGVILKGTALQETMQYYKEYTQNFGIINVTYPKSDVIKKKEGEKE